MKKKKKKHLEEAAEGLNGWEENRNEHRSQEERLDEEVEILEEKEKRKQKPEDESVYEMQSDQELFEAVGELSIDEDDDDMGDRDKKEVVELGLSE